MGNNVMWKISGGAAMNFMWLTDIHLDYLFSHEMRNFLKSLNWTEPDALPYRKGGKLEK